MGPISVTGAILVLTGWFALVEFDSFPESSRKQIVQKIKQSPTYIMIIALMPFGIVLNVLGTFFNSSVIAVIGSSFIFIQGIIVSLLFWKRKRWKSILLLVVIISLGTFIYVPLFLY